MWYILHNTINEFPSTKLQLDQRWSFQYKSSFNYFTSSFHFKRNGSLCELDNWTYLTVINGSFNRHLRRQAKRAKEVKFVSTNISSVWYLLTSSVCASEYKSLPHQKRKRECYDKVNKTKEKKKKYYKDKTKYVYPIMIYDLHRVSRIKKIKKSQKKNIQKKKCTWICTCIYMRVDGIYVRFLSFAYLLYMMRLINSLF